MMGYAHITETSVVCSRHDLRASRTDSYLEEYIKASMTLITSFFSSHKSTFPKIHSKFQKSYTFSSLFPPRHVSSQLSSSIHHEDLHHHHHPGPPHRHHLRRSFFNQTIRCFSHLQRSRRCFLLPSVPS